MGRARTALRKRHSSTRCSAPTTTARSAAATRTERSTRGATICGLAALTTTLRLGTLVTPVTFRKPSVLAKLVTTVDHISGGRVELGLGAGWFESEHAAYGFDFMTTHRPPRRARPPARGDHAPVDDADDIWPKPMQQPRPPIIVGGTRQAAHRARSRPLRRRVQHRLADGRTRRASASSVLDEAARDAGRDPLLFSMMIELEEAIARRASRSSCARTQRRPGRR